MDYRKEIERLYHLDYGDRREFLARSLLVLAAAFAVYSYLGWLRGFVWAGGFFLTHVLYFAILRSRPKICTRRDITLAGSALALVMVAFVWFPVSLLHHDDTAVRISSFVAFCTFLVFLVRRADTAGWLVVTELGIVAASVISMLLNVLPLLDHAGAKAVTVLAGAALVGYFAQTMQVHRQRRLDGEAAAQRSVQAQKMEATGQLVGGVAHDFNNILTAVLGNLELYSMAIDQSEKDELVAEARQSAERAAELIRQLLAYSRQSRLNVEEQSLAAIFDQVQTLSHRLMPSSIRISFRTAQPNTTIRVDQTQLITALINLLVNARDALEDGGTVTVAAHPLTLKDPSTMPSGYTLQPGRYVEISVQDDGPGIDPAILAKVTDPFFTTKPIGKGSGLGLSMVEGFARQLGGGLNIRSSDRGTRVSILLPATGPSEVAAPETPAG